MSRLPTYQLMGAPGEAGVQHGRLLTDILSPGFIERYTGLLCGLNRCTRRDLSRQAQRWIERLPAHFVEEMDGMAVGAGATLASVAEFLYADIARPTRMQTVHDAERAFNPAADPEPLPGDHELPAGGGPMCSGVIANLHDGNPWIARNCDWLTPTLMRGTAAVIHATPRRIPVMGLGIRGDIDVDTGMNAERLWLHLHTLAALDDPPRDRTCISWLFWAREALEICASLDDLEHYIEETGRDRGVLVFAADGKTREAAIFECTKASHVRYNFDPAEPLYATNQTLSKEIPPERAQRSCEGSTIARYCGLRARLSEQPPAHGPHDLMHLLADPRIEMRRPQWLKTIYSAVANPTDGKMWFAAGDANGTTAASGGRWEALAFPA